jgi:hypothetical protein
MAEIRVQEKRGGLAWVWILLLLVLLALAAWYFMSRPEADDTVEPAPTAAPAAAPAGGSTTEPAASPTIPKYPPPSNLVFVRA